MQILVLSHYFPPEVNAPASRTYEHCLRWAREGHDVTVVTCVPNCPDGVVFQGYRNKLRPQVEDVDGVRVVRVWTYVAPNAGTVRRIANYLSYMINAVLACLRVKRPDIVVATSPQFFCGWAGVLVSRLKRAPFLLEIRDIWPESIETVGAIRFRALLRLLEWLERWMYQAADHIVTVGAGYRENILGKVKPGTVVSVIPNGVDLDRFDPATDGSVFRKQWGADNKFLCSYIGTIGMAHGLGVVIRAAEILQQRGRDDVLFCLVGDGAESNTLRKMVRERGLGRSVLLPGRQPREAVPSILAASDACLVHLKGCELFQTVLPSKVFEIMAMGRPIIMGVKGEAREIVVQAGAGVKMEPDDADSLVQAVLRLVNEPALGTNLGSRARECVAERFNRNNLAQVYLQLICDLVADCCGTRQSAVECAPTSPGIAENATPSGYAKSNRLPG